MPVNISVMLGGGVGVGKSEGVGVREAVGEMLGETVIVALASRGEAVRVCMGCDEVAAGGRLGVG